MSLGSEERRVMVDLEIERAKKTMDEMDYLAKGGLWNNMASRLYYAVFHAVSALMIHDCHTVNTHKGSHVIFSQYYIRTGKLPKEYGQLYRQLEIMRNDGDYNCYYNVSPDELLGRLEPAKEMIATIANMVKA